MEDLNLEVAATPQAQASHVDSPLSVWHCGPERNTSRRHSDACSHVFVYGQRHSEHLSHLHLGCQAVNVEPKSLYISIKRPAEAERAEVEEEEEEVEEAAPAETLPLREQARLG